MKKGFVSIVEALILSVHDKKKRRRYVNQPEDSTGWSALHLACIGGHVDCVSFLLSHGASKISKNKLGELPVDCVILTSKSRTDDCERLHHLVANEDSKDNRK